MRLDDGARFCSKCGATIAVAAPAPQPLQQYQPSAMAATASATTSSYPSFPARQQYPAPGTPMEAVPVAPAWALYAGFWVRVVAYILDFLIIGILVFVFVFTLNVFSIPLDIAAVWLYFALMESSERQATLGKSAMNIYVTDMYGRRISFGQATGRYFSKILSNILCIGYIMVAFTEKKQGLHDIIAGTLVRRRL
jgi:uncharacterized RDD family membrane protein YckC